MPDASAASWFDLVCRPGFSTRSRSRSTRAFLGPLLLWASKREDKRLARGQTYEPPTIVERRNWVEA